MGTFREIGHNISYTGYYNRRHRRIGHLYQGRFKAIVADSVKDQPSYRMIQSVEAEALIKQAADYFRLEKADLIRKRGQHRQERALVMELLHRHSGLKQRMIGERLGGLDEGLVSRDRRAIREKIETEPTIRKWFKDLSTTLRT